MATERTEQEERWIKEQEREQQARLHAEDEAAERKRREQAEAEARKSHYMKCPKCGHDLEEIDHDHLKVDRCTNCKGIWLDPGEMDELLTRKNWDLLGFFRK